MRRVVVTTGALRDLARLAGWLQPVNPIAAGDARDALIDAMNSLRELADRGRPVSRGLRELPVDYGRDGYVLRYRTSPTTVTIARIFHARELR